MLSGAWHTWSPGRCCDWENSQDSYAALLRFPPDTPTVTQVIICCGHYGCGAVKGALQLPSKAQGLVNCWISDIRECRNQHHAELKQLPSPESQVG